MLRRIAKCLLLMLSLWLAVGPLAVLQIGAWGWMIASYSQESSIEQAFRETFGGDRPCEVCRIIDSVEQTGETPAHAPSKNESKSLKLMLGLSREIIVPIPATQRWSMDCATAPLVSALQSVPTPPPRSFV